MCGHCVTQTALVSFAARLPQYCRHHTTDCTSAWADCTSANWCTLTALLQESPPFDKLSNELCQRMVTVMERCEVADGSTLLREGEYSTRAFVLINGELQLTSASMGNEQACVPTLRHPVRSTPTSTPTHLPKSTRPCIHPVFTPACVLHPASQTSHPAPDIARGRAHQPDRPYLLKPRWRHSESQGRCGHAVVPPAHYLPARDASPPGAGGAAHIPG